MITFVPTMPSDIDRITEWTAADPWHTCQMPEWWLTGTGYLSFRVQDDVGPVAYIKVEEEDERFRLHCQFGPRAQVSRARLLGAMKYGLPTLISHLIKQKKEVIFSSESPSLINFMVSKGFEPSSDIPGDYVLKVLGAAHV